MLKYFALTLTLDPWGQVKRSFFLKIVMLHIKLTGMKHKTACKQKFCPLKHTLYPCMRSKGQKKYSENVYVTHYQI